MKDGQAVWVQGKKAIVSHTKENQVWVTFENEPNVAYEYSLEKVCSRTI